MAGRGKCRRLRLYHSDWKQVYLFSARAGGVAPLPEKITENSRDEEVVAEELL